MIEFSAQVEFDIEQQIVSKNRSMITDSRNSEMMLISSCSSRYSPVDMSHINTWIQLFKTLESDDPDHPSMALYLAHPYRVANSLFTFLKDPTPELIIFGMFHNIFEVTNLKDKDVSSMGMPKKFVDAIRTLTIDREQEFDVRYLTYFHAEIELEGDHAVLMRALDKLDNVLAFKLIRETAHRRRYLDLVLQYTVPMANKLNSELGCTIRKVTEYMQINGCDDCLAQDYEKYVEVSLH